MTLNMFYATEYRNKTVYDILIANQPPYRSVRYKVAEDPTGDPNLVFVLYLENFAAHSSAQQSSIAEWAGGVINKIRGAGIPCYLMKARDN